MSMRIPFESALEYVAYTFGWIGPQIWFVRRRARRIDKAIAKVREDVERNERALAWLADLIEYRSRY